MDHLGREPTAFFNIIKYYNIPQTAQTRHLHVIRLFYDLPVFCANFTQTCKKRVRKKGRSPALLKHLMQLHDHLFNLVLFLGRVRVRHKRKNKLFHVAAQVICRHFKRLLRNLVTAILLFCIAIRLIAGHYLTRAGSQMIFQCLICTAPVN